MPSSAPLFSIRSRLPYPRHFPLLIATFASIVQANWTKFIPAYHTAGYRGNHTGRHLLGHCTTPSTTHVKRPPLSSTFPDTDSPLRCIIMLLNEYIDNLLREAHLNRSLLTCWSGHCLAGHNGARHAHCTASHCY